MNLTILPVPAMGAEDVVVTPDGDVFTGTEDGSIWRLTSDGGQIVRVAHTGGRPLGLELYDDGHLLRVTVGVSAGRGQAEHHVAPRLGPGRTLAHQCWWRADALLQQRRDCQRRHDLVLRLLQAVRHRAMEGRLRSEHPYRTAVAPRP